MHQILLKGLRSQFDATNSHGPFEFEAMYFGDSDKPGTVQMPFYYILLGFHVPNCPCTDVQSSNILVVTQQVVNTQNLRLGHLITNSTSSLANCPSSYQRHSVLAQPLYEEISRSDAYTQLNKKAVESIANI